MQIKPATRQGIKPLIGLYAESGCGKTYSALLMARGIAGPRGKIVMIDTESGRGSYYADLIPGGYDVLELTEPFSPSRYVEAFRAAEASNPAVIIADSMTHEWDSAGGVTDMATDSARRRASRKKEPEDWDGVVQFGDWKEPKMEHAKFMARLLQSRVPMILCVRAKYRSHQVKGTQQMADDGEIQKWQIGKSIVLKDRFTTPIQADDFIFEMTAHAEIFHDHSIRLTKCSHPSLRDCFPKEGPITIQTGEAIARWCAGSTATTPASGPANEDQKRLNALKKRLFAVTEKVHGGRAGAPNKSAEDRAAEARILEQWLWDEAILDLDKQLSSQTADELENLLPKVEAKLKGAQ